MSKFRDHEAGAPNAFEQERQHYETLIGADVVQRTTLLESLRNLQNTGMILLSEETITDVEFGEAMREAYESALELHEDDDIQPPLVESQVKMLQGGIRTYGKFAAAAENEAATTRSAPTNTSSIKTAGAKS